MEESKQRVFISHSSHDADSAKKICTALEDKGIKCWIAPRDIPYGSEWPEEIYTAVKDKCDAFVFLFSEYSNASRHCEREIKIADKFGIPTLCIVTDDTEMNYTLEYFLSNDQIMPVDSSMIDDRISSIVAETMRLMDDARQQSVVDEEESIYFNDEEKYRLRFSYKARCTDLIGRKDEIEFLRGFCEDNPEPIAWTAVYGEGGTGKSKLVYEFCDMIRVNGWHTISPRSAKTYESYFLNHIEHIHCNTIFCFDYIKFELDTVNKLIKLVSDLHLRHKLRHKVRFILIERSIDDIKYSFNTRIASYHYLYGDLELHSLPENEICDLIDNYIKNITEDTIISYEDKKKIIEALKRIDPNLLRPLFVLFVTDAWLDGKLESITWDKESSVKYITEKEIERIHNAAESQQTSPGKARLYHAALRFIIAYITFVNQASLEEICEVSSSVFHLDAFETEQLLRGYINVESNTLKGLEPDLIGEYACLNILNELETRYVDTFFELMHQSYFYNMIAFVYKIDTDFTSAFSNSTWKSKVTNISIPLSISYIKNGMFGNCSFIEKIHLHSQITAICKFAFHDCKRLEEINLPNSLEVIEEAAFQNCISLKRVCPVDGKGWIPSVILIGSRAFKNCKSLSEFRLPASVQTLGSGAFEKCSSLKSITLAREITCIESNTFEDCIALNEVVCSKVNKGLAIKQDAFRGCTSLKRIIGSTNITEIGKSAFYHCESLKTIKLSNKLTKIDNHAFTSCNKLKAVDLEETLLTKIEDNTFKSCSSLEIIRLPKKLKSIRSSAFAYCESLTSIVLPSTCTKIASHVFLGCKKLSLSSFGETPPQIREFCAFGVKKVDEDILGFVTSYYERSELSLPKGVIQIGKQAFLDHVQLTKLCIPEPITEIGEEAFRGCKNLKCIQASFEDLTSLGKAAFYNCRSLEELPAFIKIDIIPSLAFYGCENLNNVCIRSTINNIGKNAFAGCTNLQWVDLVKKCSVISALAFAGCDSFNLSKSFHISPKKGKYYIGGFIFKQFGDVEKEFINNYRDQETVIVPQSCIGFFENPFIGLRKIHSITIPDSVQTFIDYNFSNIPNLKEIKLPKSIGYQLKCGFFSGSQSLESFIIGNNDQNCVPCGINIARNVFDGCKSLRKVYLPEGTKIIRSATFRDCSSLTDITIPDSVEVIQHEAFCGCSSLTILNVPNSLKTLGVATFKNCTSLKAVYGLELTTIQSLPKELFRGCLSLRTVSIPNSLSSISPYAFYDCRALPELDITYSSVNYIGLAAFQNCFMMKKFIVPAAVTEIQKFTFKSCTQLEEIILPPSIEKIGVSAFYDCNALTAIDTDHLLSLSEIGDYAFSDCHKLEAIVVPQNVKKLSNGMFRRCVSLKTIEMHANFREIPRDCFYGCRQLEKISSNDEIEYVGAGAFRNCYNLKDFSVFRNISKAEPAAFRSCHSLENIVLTRISNIHSALFMDCINLRNVCFPKVKHVGNYAFCDCKNLESATIENVTDEIGLGAFWNCENLKKVIFSDSITTIQPSAFRCCNSIKKVEFPKSVSKIHATVFRGANSLQSIIIPDSVETIRKSAFRDCTSLTTVQIQSTNVEIHKTAFMDCTRLYYFTFNGQLNCHPSAFDGTPIYGTLKKNSKIMWMTLSENDDSEE